jgi:curved DNA-binding protein CbpA
MTLIHPASTGQQSPLLQIRHSGTTSALLMRSLYELIVACLLFLVFILYAVCFILDDVHPKPADKERSIPRSTARPHLATMRHHEPVKPSRPDHYFNLGLATSATSLDVKTAFRKLALLHHPDKKGLDADAAIFRQIRDAHDVLIDPSTRLAYDRSYPRLRTQWAEYRRDYAEYLQRTEVEQQRREQEDADRMRRAEERSHAEAEREEKERLSRFANQRAQREREQAGIDILRQLVEADDQARLAKKQEAEARSARVAERARAEQSRRALERLQHHAAGVKAREESKATANEALAAKQASCDASRAQTAKSERIKIAQIWANEKHARHESLQASQSHPQSLDVDYIQLDWDEKHVSAICDFCSEEVRLYHHQCPLGGAVACGNCMNRLSLSKL